MISLKWWKEKLKNSKVKIGPGGSDDKQFAFYAGDPDSSPGLGRSPGEGIGNPLQYSCLENSMDRGAWWATVHRVAKGQTRLKLLSIAQGSNLT